MPQYTIEVDVQGRLDAAQINKLIRDFQKQVGSKGGVQLFDAKQIARDGHLVEEELRRMQAELGQVREESRKLQNEVAQLRKNGQGLGKAFQLNQITDSLRNVADGLAQVQGPMVDLDRSVRNIGTLGRENFQEFTQLALDMSRRIPNSAADIASAAYDAISAGITGTNQQIADFVESAAKLGVAGLTSTGDAVNSLTSILNAYGLSADKATLISDQLFNVVNAGKVSVPELNAALASVLPTAAAAGVSFDQLGGAIATMTKNGVPANQAATKLNALLTELQKPGAALAPILTAAGVSLDSLKADGLQETMRKVGLALDAAGTNAVKAFSSIEAGGAALLLTGDKAQGAAADLAAVRDTMGSTEAAFAIASEGIGVKTELLKNKFNALVTQGLSKLGSGINVAISGLSSLAPSLTALAQAKTLIPDGAIEKAGTLIKGKLLPSVLSLIPGFAGVGSAAGAAGTAGAAGMTAMLAPILPIVLGIGAVVALFVLLYNRSETFRNAIKRLLDGLIGGVQAVWGIAKPILNAILDIIGELGALWLDLVIAPFQIAIEVLSQVGSAIGGAVSSIPGASAVFDALGFVVDKVQFGLLAMKAAIAGVRAAIEASVGAVGDFFGSLLSGDIGGAIDVLSNAGTEAGEAFVQAAGESMNESLAKISIEKGAKALEEQLTLKGDLDRAGRLDELVAKMKGATTEAERNSIGEAIAKQFPKAVRATETYVDAQGKVHQNWELNERAAEKYSEKAKDAYGDDLKQRQLDAISGLSAQIGLYEQNKSKLVELGDELERKRALGLDTSDAQKAFDEMKDEVEKGKGEIEQQIGSLDSSGLFKDLPPEAQAAFDAIKKENAGTFDDLAAKARETKLGEILSKGAQIQGNLDQNDELGKLLEKFRSTSDEAEKESLAARIAQEAPNAVAGMQTIIDKNGQVKTVYQINADKAQEFFEANKKAYSGETQSLVDGFKTSLSEQADEFQRNKDRAAELASKIVEGVKNGQDVSKLREEYAKLQTRIGENAAGLAKTVEQGKKFGLIKGDVKQVGTEFGLTKRQADGITEATQRIKKGVESAATAAARLAKKFDEAKQAADASATAAISGLAQAYANLDAALKAKNAAQIQVARENVEQQQTYAREAVRNSDNLAAYLVRAETFVGRRKKEERQKEKKDIIDAGTEVRNALRDLVNEGSLAAAGGDLERQLEQLRQQMEAEQAQLLQTAQSLRDQAKDKGKTVTNQDQIRELERGGKGFLLIEAKYDRLRREARIKFYGAQLSGEQKQQEILLQTQLQRLKFEEEKIEGADEAAISRRLAKRLELLNLQQAIELEQMVTGNQDYIDEYGKLQDLLVQRDQARTSEEQAILQHQIDLQSASLGQLRQNLILHGALAQGIATKFQIERAKAEEEILSVKYTADLKLLEDAQRRETASRERHAEQSKRILENVASFAQKLSDRLIDRQQAIELERLEDQQARLLISKEAFEARKAELERRAAEDREAFQARALGAQLEAERQTALASLLLQAQQLEAKRKLAQEAGRTEEATALQGQLDELGTQIEDKGSVLVGLAGELQGNLTELFTNLLANDESQLKAPFKKAFSVIFGALQRLASAKVYEVLLGSISGLGGVPALLASFALKPIVEAIMNAALSPLFDRLLSFPTGGRFDGPTLALIGDASRLGGTDREWLFRDEQLRQVLTEAIAANNYQLIAAIESLGDRLQRMEIDMVLRGEDLSTATRRHESRQAQRIVGQRKAA